MSGQKKTSLARIRTYAQDLDEQRKKLAPTDATAAVHTVVAEPVVVSKPKPVAPTYTPPSPVVSKTVFPPAEKPKEIVTPLPTIKKTPQTSPAQIPAFHELQQELQNNINPKKPDTSAFSQPFNKPAPPKISVTQPNIKPKDTVALSGGTVITDTKRAEFSLFGAILGSINDFFQSVIEHFNKPKATPKYTVTAPERRKGVIQKATSKTGTIFTADNETLKEEILRRQREQAAKPDITWTPHTEPGFPLLTDTAATPTITDTVVHYEPEPIPAPVPEPILPPTVPTEDERRWSEPAPVSPPAPRIIVAPPTPKIVIAPPAPEPIPAVVPPPEPIRTPEPPLPPPVPKPAPKPKVKRQWFAGLKQRFITSKPSYGSLTTVNTNVVTITIVGVLAGIVIIGFAGRSLLLVLSPESVPTTSEMKAPLIAADRNGTILFTPGSVNSVEQIISASVSTTGSGLTEIRFLDNNQVELSPQTLFSLFGFRTNPNFNQSVTTKRLISLDGQHRAFVLEVSDPTTVFGAMLEWEQEMYTDVGELLNLTVTQPESGRFIDRTIGQSDVRILVVNGQEILIYGFISSNLLVITSDSTQFTRILQAQ